MLSTTRDKLLKDGRGFLLVNLASAQQEMLVARDTGAGSTVGWDKGVQLLGCDGTGWWPREKFLIIYHKGHDTQSDAGGLYRVV